MQFCVRLLAVGLIFAISSPTSRGQGEQPSTDRGELRRILQDQWDSLATLEFTSEDAVKKNNGETLNPIITKYSYKNPSKRFISTAIVTKQGESTKTEFFEDGQSSHSVVSKGGKPLGAQVRDQQNTSNSYGGGLCGALWAFTPGGQPCFTLIEPDTVIQEIEDDDGEILVRVEGRLRGQPIVLELDPKHDYLPKKLRTGDPTALTLEVQRFEQDNGRWFPVEGVFGHEGVDGDTRTFRATSLRINRPIDPSAFGPPTLPDGIALIDHRTGETRVIGSAKPDAEERGSAQAKRPDEGMRADGPRNLVGWAALVIVLSVGFLATAVVLRLRRGRQ